MSTQNYRNIHTLQMERFGLRYTHPIRHPLVKIEKLVRQSQIVQSAICGSDTVVTHVPNPCHSLPW